MVQNPSRRELSDELIDKKNDAREIINRISHDLENKNELTSDDLEALFHLADSLSELSADLFDQFHDEQPE
jgi:hypothetical protein